MSMFVTIPSRVFAYTSLAWVKNRVALSSSNTNVLLMLLVYLPSSLFDSLEDSSTIIISNPQIAQYLFMYYNLIMDTVLSYQNSDE